MNNFYAKEIRSAFNIVDKRLQVVPFKVNKAQGIFLNELSNRMIILKARQEGISSVILALFALDFIGIPHSRSVVISHEEGATQKLLERVRFFLNSYAQKHGEQEFHLKTNSKKELVNADNGATFYIGTANQKALARGDTIKNLHFSEVAFYGDRNVRLVVTGAMNAVPDLDDTRIFFESTANGYNDFKDRWDKAVAGATNFKPLFIPASYLYTQEFLESKRLEIGDDDLFRQEYPQTPQEAFIVTGTPFFNMDRLNAMLEKAKGVKIIERGNISISGEWYV